MYDLRDHARKPNLELRCHDQGLTGMAIRPSGILATATMTPQGSDLHFSEIRMGSGLKDSTCAPLYPNTVQIVCPQARGTFVDPLELLRQLRSVGKHVAMLGTTPECLILARFPK